MRRRLAVLPLLLFAFLLWCLPEGTDAAAKRKKKSPKSKAKEVPVNFDKNLPVLGTRLATLPPGEGKALVEIACVRCHSGDMLRQQRLNEKQWSASVAKMVGWGAPVPESSRDALIAYLVANFGPDNDRFEPVVTRPVGR